MNHTKKTPKEVKEALRQQGKTLKEFAEERNLPAMQVYRVMNGTIKGTRGRGHQIAIALGLK